MEVAENEEAAMAVSLYSLYTLLNQALVKVLVKMERLVLFFFLSYIQTHVQIKRQLALASSHPSVSIAK